MYSISAKFTRITQFLLVLLVTLLSWTFTGKMVQLLLPTLPILVFLMVGLGAGLLLASLLSCIHQEPDPDTVPARAI